MECERREEIKTARATNHRIKLNNQTSITFEITNQDEENRKKTNANVEHASREKRIRRQNDMRTQNVLFVYFFYAMKNESNSNGESNV